MRASDRTATLTAFVNAEVVYLLPVTLVGAIALVAPAYTNGSTHVRISGGSPPGGHRLRVTRPHRTTQVTDA